MISNSIKKARQEKLENIPYTYNLDSFSFSTVSEQPVSRQPERRLPETPPQGRPQPALQRPEQKKLSDTLQVSMDPFSLSDTLWLNDKEFHAGSLKDNIHIWRKITNDPQILKLISGTSLSFTERPYQDKLPHEIQFTGNFKNLVAREIEKFLSQGIIEHTNLHEGDYLSNLFAQPKKDSRGTLD